MFRIIALLTSLWLFKWVFAATNYMPWINCFWLPWCNTDDIKVTDKLDSFDIDDNFWLIAITSLIEELILFVSVFAVIALIISGVMYLISWWEEEKTKKAKTWIIWSLVGVILSISAWGIINMLNNLVIG